MNDFFSLLTSKPLVALARYITKFTRFAQAVSTITYAAAMTPDLTLGGWFRITISDGNAMTINAPTGTAQTGEVISFTLRNASGGAAGAATWNAVFKMAAWAQAANGNSRSISFRYDGTNWVEFARTTADVPN